MEINFRPYQVDDIKLLTNNKRMINANEPGLGKTLETLTAMANLNVGKTLIISPKMAAGVWQFEADQWYGWDSIRVTGEYSKKVREEIRREFTTSNLQFMMINFAMIAETQAWQSVWNTIVVDEAHLGGLLNPKSKTFGLMQKFKCENLFILTGTPIRKGPQDLWPMLHLVAPKRFPAYWPFVNKHCHVLQGRFGKEILNRPKYPKEFKAMVSQYMVRHLKKDVLEELPDKVRQPIPLEMNPVQAQAYAEMLDNMILDTGNDIIVASNRMTQDLRLRQLAVCPKMIGIDDYGASIETLVEELIPQEFDVGRAVVIATPFRTAIPFLIEAINASIKDVQIEQIHGKIEETAQQVAQRFQEIKTHRKILIYTIKSGASWTAHSASTGFMLGYEWSTNDDWQAEDRIHRIGQKNTVFWKYLMLNGTIDEAVMSRLDEKSMAAGWILKPEEMFARMKELQNKNLYCPMNRTKNKV